MMESTYCFYKQELKARVRFKKPQWVCSGLAGSVRAWLPNHLSIGSERIEDRTQTELVKGIHLKKINNETNLLNFFFCFFVRAWILFGLVCCSKLPPHCANILWACCQCTFAWCKKLTKSKVWGRDCFLLPPMYSKMASSMSWVNTE